MKLTFHLLLMLTTLLTAIKVNAQTVIPAEPVSENNYIKDFLCREVFYPETALENDVEGEVVISFFVQDDGEVTDAHIIKHVSPELDREALRVFSMIRWKPAMRLGNPVASLQEFSIDFNIRKYKKHCRERGFDSLVYPFKPVDSTMVIYKPGEVDALPYPVFEDRDMNLGNFLRSEFNYPEQAYKQSISGPVKVNFIVEKHGSISNVEIARSVGGGCNEEAVRLISMLKWMPGIKDGMAVRTRMSMDITFRLPGDSGMRILDYNFNNSL